MPRTRQYTSPEDEKLDVLVVHLTTEAKLERARTAIRNFVADHLKQRNEKDAALVAFVSPTERQWRFSYVKMEYAAVEKDDGKVGVETRLTPARRLSYIVGEGESCHTAQSRFLALLQDTENNPTLAQIEDAFSVEAVTKEFFNQYAALFGDIEAALRKLAAKDPGIGKEFKTKNLSTVGFAKKLMGQIVFLYFLQKKGWLGVAKGQDWGTGPHDFLRRLCRGEHGPYKNFFNDVLEPLFYDTLATDRGHEAWCSRFKCRIPFLNGGLFEPLGDYDWRKTDITLPNKLFTNTERNEAGEIGTGVLDVFDRYNFTVNEAEPLEKEVAIDPEMLGKVFENLIEENRRKGLGSFYTPREIVHYMCQESLINYLDTAINSYAEAIGREKRKQAQFGDEKAEQTLLTAPVRQEVVPRADLETFVHLGDQYSFYEAAKQSGTIGRDYPKPPKSIEQHARLIDDKLADITICDPAVGSGAFPVGMMTEIVRARSALTPYFNDVQDRTPYHFKRHAIQDCLYGVDIDPGAVEIAKLRLWLSLVVDEEDVKQIKPLPNLFYKIVTGNSLLGVEKNLFNQQLFQKLEKLKPLYFDQTDSSKKSNLKHQIDQIIHELTNGKEAFDFEIYFSEVFHGKGGFDVVIANPPYGIVFDRILKAKYESAYPTFKRNNDLYVAFYQRGVGLSRQRGHLTYISPNTFLNGDYFKKLREFLTAATVLRKVWDYKSVPIFDDPTVFVCVLTCTKDRATATPYHVSLHVAASSATSFQTTAFQITGASEEPFKSLNPILQRSLRRRGFAELDSHFFVKDVGFNYWTEGRGKTRGQNSIGDRVFYAGQQLNERDMPFLKGRDIHKWHIQEPSNFLRHNYERLLNDADTLRYSSEFLSLKPKVVYRQTANTIIAAIDSAGSFVDKTVHLIVPRQNWNACSPRLLVALLNSKLFAYF